MDENQTEQQVKMGTKVQGRKKISARYILMGTLLTLIFIFLSITHISSNKNNDMVHKVDNPAVVVIQQGDGSLLAMPKSNFKDVLLKAYKTTKGKHLISDNELIAKIDKAMEDGVLYIGECDSLLQIAISTAENNDGKVFKGIIMNTIIDYLNGKSLADLDDARVPAL